MSPYWTAPTAEEFAESLRSRLRPDTVSFDRRRTVHRQELVGEDFVQWLTAMHTDYPDKMFELGGASSEPVADKPHLDVLAASVKS